MGKTQTRNLLPPAHFQTIFPLLHNHLPLIPSSSHTHRPHSTQATLGWQVKHGPAIAPDMPRAERSDYGQVILERRLRDTLAELNSTLPASALEDAFRKLIRPEGVTLEARNRAFHRMLVNGVTVEYES